MNYCQHMHGYVLIAWNPLTQYCGHRQGNTDFLKQEVKNQVKTVTLTAVDFIKESTSISLKFTLELLSLKSLHIAYWI